MSFTPPFTRLRRLVRKVIRGPKLPLALTAAILLSIVLTCISVAWYSLDGSSKLDLSRPGYEQVRTQVLSNDTQKTYDTTSPVTKSAIDSFTTEYDSRSKELQSYGSFSDGTLDDNNIQLSAPSDNSATQ